MQGARFQRLSALIVDDNANMRDLVRAILQALGVNNMIDAREGEHAIEKIKNFNVDLVITDWLMEPMDGLALTRWVRSSDESPDQFLPVIMLSGHTELSRITHARDAGVNEFIAKPVAGKALYTRLLAVIEKPRPYVKTKSYFGPDRRRKVESFDGEERRQTD